VGIAIALYYLLSLGECIRCQEIQSKTRLISHATTLNRDNMKVIHTRFVNRLYVYGKAIPVTGRVGP
jgi:hypothetical protein